MDQDKLQVLKLNPKYRLFPKVILDTIRKQAGIGNHKARWDKLSRLWDKQGNEIIEEKENKTMEQMVQEESHREIWDPNTNTIDFKKVRASDVRNNPRVVIPKARNVKEEAELAARTMMIEDEVKKFIMENPENEKNLTASEFRGYQKLLKRVATGEIIV